MRARARGVAVALWLAAVPALGEEPAGAEEATRAAAARAGGVDQLRLEATAVRGNQELPKVLYIVPWKEPTAVKVTGRPVNSLVEEVLAPVDREVFRRQVRYFEQLYSRADAGGEPGAE